MRSSHCQRDGFVVAQEGDADEVQKKLWGQLFLMAGYDLDVDCPVERPTPESRSEAPGRLITPVRCRVWGTTAN